MKIAVMGTGGVGALFGARLARASNEVHFVARGAHLDAIAQNGLKIESTRRGDILLKPANVTDDPSTIGVCDYVLFTVKLWDTESAARMIKPLVGKDTAVISLQNGVVRDQILREALGAQHVLGGISYVGATIKAPGIIEQKGDVQKLVFNEYDKGQGPLSPRVAALKEACLAAELECETPADIEKALWEKFVVLVGMSTVLAATRQTIGPVRDNEATRELLRQVMTEVTLVAHKKGIAFDKDIVEQKMHYLTQLAPEVTASMQHDLSQGNRLELPWLAGTVVDMGNDMGVETPVCDVLTAVLSPYVMGTKR